MSIYGGKSISGINVPNGYQFGLVSQLLGGCSGTVDIGESVLFALKDGIAVNYSDTQYFLVQENNIILIETDLP